jgi:hypothetical protein
VTDAEQKEIEANVIKLRKGGADIETLLSFMREKGLSESESLHPLMKAANVERDVARDLIIDSQTWIDHRESNIQLQENVLQAWLELSQEDNPGAKVVVEFEEPDERDAITIYVRLLDEGTEVWRPAKAVTVGEGLYRLLATPDYDLVDEEWEFPPGSIVAGKQKIGSDGEFLAAIRP